MRSLILSLLFAAAAFAQHNQIQVLLADTDAPVTPVDMPGGGTYSSTQSVTITDATATFILYTLDGSTPACPGTGTLYTGAFNISSTSTLKAIGCNGITGGAVLTSVYTITAGQPTLSVQQEVVGHPSGASLSVTSTQAHSLLTVWTGNVSITSVSDSINGTWTEALGGVSCSYNSQPCYFYYFCNAAAGVTSVTPNGGSGQVSMVFKEVTVTGGTPSNCAIDTQSIISAPGGSPWTSASVTPTTSLTEFMAGAIWYTVDASAGTGWTLTGNGSQYNNAYEYRIVTSTSGTYAATGTSSSGYANAAIITFHW